MSDFFTELERELHAAAGRPPRRLAWLPRAGGIGVTAAVAAVAFAVALVPAVVILGSGDEPADPADEPRPPAVGTVIPEGEGVPPRDADSTVVATGRTKIAGPWQIETYLGRGLRDPATGEEYEPAGLRCLRLVLTDPPDGSFRASGACGEFPKSPGFSRLQVTVPNRRMPGQKIDPDEREMLVYGRVPQRARAVVVGIVGANYVETVAPRPGPPGDRSNYYLVALPYGTKGRVNWQEQNGQPGGKSIELLPP